MKVMLTRSMVLLVFSLLLIGGVVLFAVNFLTNAARWAHFPTNPHLYEDGEWVSSATIYDSTGEMLVNMEGSNRQFHQNHDIRTALMHATGDSNDHVATGAQVAFRPRLSGWSLVNGLFNLEETTPPGEDLTLTLDANLSAVAYRELAGRRGAVGVYNYETGEILCMVSSPSFDPANPPPAAGESAELEGAFINRFLSANYTPGSIFKLVTTAAAIENLENLHARRFHCEQVKEVGEDTISCLSYCGEINLEEALANSCNVAFAEIALELGADTLQEYANLAGFNQALEVDGIPTAAGLIDVSEAEGADLAWAGIGQYTNTANPLNFMALMGAIANEGKRVDPILLEREGLFSSMADSIFGETQIFAPSTAQKLQWMMRNNFESSFGEEYYSHLKIAAKSGTAEVGGDQAPHAWYAGYMGRDDYPLAFVVIIENGGSGSRVAAPVAINVLQKAVEQP